jgi:hypothetical protein
MFSPSRRVFLGASLAGLISGRILGADDLADVVKKPLDDPTFQPSTLFLTWQHDPTTTMTVQWIGAIGETADTTVSYSAAQAGPWQVRPSYIKPYPMTDLKGVPSQKVVT